MDSLSTSEPLRLHQQLLSAPPHPPTPNPHFIFYHLPDLLSLSFQSSVIQQGSFTYRSLNIFWSQIKTVPVNINLVYYYNNYTWIPTNITPNKLYLYLRVILVLVPVMLHGFWSYCALFYSCTASLIMVNCWFCYWTSQHMNCIWLNVSGLKYIFQIFWKVKSNSGEFLSQPDPKIMHVEPMTVLVKTLMY